MSTAPKITALRGGGVSLAGAADAFLATPRRGSAGAGCGGPDR
ncbi:hypothetical protein AB0I81_18670 [Nonomuraea sp. NPDC050404]